MPRDDENDARLAREKAEREAKEQAEREQQFDETDLAQPEALA